MLKHLQKFFNAPKEEVPEMMTQEEQTVQAAVDTNAAELTAQLASASETLVAMQAQFAELSAKYDNVQATLSAIESEKAALVAKAAEAKLTARKEKVEAALGTAKAPAILAATEALDDASFEAIVAAFSANLEAESKSPLFTEVGVSAEAAPVAVDPVAKLAANLAAQFNKGNK